MSTMTELPSASVWLPGIPGGDAPLPFPRLTSDSSSSIISPLTLPRGVAGCFDHVATKSAVPPQLVGPAQPHSRGGRVYSPLSPGARGPALPHPSFLSPHLLSITKGSHYQPEQRSSSLPPKARNSITSPRAVDLGPRAGQGLTIDALPLDALSPTAGEPIPSMGVFPAGHPRSISADAASAPPHLYMIQRLIQQNGRIREAWEAERKYLEANRERAEEVYKEERSLMEEERAEWEAEKAVLLQEIERLCQQVKQLERGARSSSKRALAVPSASFAVLGLRGGALAASLESSGSSRSPQRNTPQSTAQSNGSRTRNGNSSFSQTLLRRPGEASLSPSGDFLRPASVSEAQAGPVPIVDVQEIHPELEGIRIKATTIQKSTFSDRPSRNGSRTSSRSASPPTSTAEKSKVPRGEKDQTLRVLAANEADRLTMHAGHTPSHSLSLLATVASSGTATVTSDGGSTPTMQQVDGASSPGPAAAAGGGGETGVTHNTGPSAGVFDGENQPLGDHPEPILEPSEDRKLKGPLMVRNMPAHDEIFFQKLSDKLAVVSKDGKAALPAVLKDFEPSESAKGQSKSHSGDSATDNDESDEDELDVPLKFRKRMNFGAPFGEIR